MAKDNPSGTVRVEGSITLALALLELARHIEGIPKPSSIIEIDSYASATSGTNETVIVLKASDGFMDWLSTVGSLEVKRNVGG
jgi:hypothetical protein